MRQRIIYEAPVSLNTQRMWFGDRAVTNMLAITDIIRPYLEKIAPDMRPFYQSYFVRQMDNESNLGIDRRILSNLIPDCPVFYPIRHRETFNINASGFATVYIPNDLVNKIEMIFSSGEKTQDLIVGSGEFACQDVLSCRRIQPKYLRKQFGKPVPGLIEAVNDLIRETGANDKDAGLYMAYLIRQYAPNSRIYYEGIAITNLVNGCPVIYPLYHKDFAANRTNGFRSVVLPDDLKHQIASLDYRGCRLSPND